MFRFVLLLILLILFRVWCRGFRVLIPTILVTGALGIFAKEQRARTTPNPKLLYTLNPKYNCCDPNS